MKMGKNKKEFLSPPTLLMVGFRIYVSAKVELCASERCKPVPLICINRRNLTLTLAPTLNLALILNLTLPLNLNLERNG